MRREDSTFIVLILLTLSYQVVCRAKSQEQLSKNIHMPSGDLEDLANLSKIYGSKKGFVEKNIKANEANNLGSNPYFPYTPITGYIDIYNEGNSMFYWLSPARENPDKAPVIIWLEGGPGGSSVNSLFWFLGPLEVKNYPEEKKARIRKISWNQKANIIFPDYPLGTGFSTNTENHIARTRKDIEDQMLRFYQGFLEKHPEFKGREIYVAGESFGGHSVPYTAHALKYSDNPDINLKGIFISSGMIYGVDFFGSYPEFALLNKNYTKITKLEYEEMSKRRDVCVHLIKRGHNKFHQYNGFLACELLYYVKFLMSTGAKNKKFNPLYMKGDFKFNFNSDLFLNSTGVKQYLKVRKDNYDSNNITFLFNLCPDGFRRNSSPLIGQLLDDGVRTVVIDGTEDFICNYQQEEKSIDDMDWSGKESWSKAARKPCQYGLCKEYKNLKQIRVPGSGHGISIYKPEFGLEIINTLMFGDQK